MSRDYHHQGPSPCARPEGLEQVIADLEYVIQRLDMSLSSAHSTELQQLNRRLDETRQRVDDLAVEMVPVIEEPSGFSAPFN